MPGAENPAPEIEPVVIGVGEWHFGGVHRAGDRLLDKGIPAPRCDSAPETRLVMS